MLMNGINDRQMRAVTHYDVSREDCQRAAGLIAEIASRRAVASSNIS